MVLGLQKNSHLLKKIDVFESFHAHQLESKYNYLSSQPEAAFLNSLLTTSDLNNDFGEKMMFLSPLLTSSMACLQIFMS